MDALRLSKTDLNPIGFPITILTAPPVIEAQFLRPDYAYARSSPPVWLREGECAIDAGAAWGDTALRFAHEVGARGRVFSFEFEPRNLEILDKNLELNPTLAERITVVRKPVWSDSTTTLSYVSSGPGSRVSEEAKDLRENQVLCVSIDDFAETLPQVDFIKMDIEGAELPALHGAEKTIRRHRPKLAICVYHSLEDFVDVPAYLVSLGLEYDFHLDHSTIHSEETVLFAAPRAQTG